MLPEQDLINQLEKIRLRMDEIRELIFNLKDEDRSLQLELADLLGASKGSVIPIRRKSSRLGKVLRLESAFFGDSEDVAFDFGNKGTVVWPQVVVEVAPQTKNGFHLRNRLSVHYLGNPVLSYRIADAMLSAAQPVKVPACKHDEGHHGDPDSIHLHLCNKCNAVVDY